MPGVGGSGDGGEVALPGLATRPATQGEVGMLCYVVLCCAICCGDLTIVMPPYAAILLYVMGARYGASRVHIQLVPGTISGECVCRRRCVWP